MADKSIHWVRTAQDSGERLSDQAPLGFIDGSAPDVASITVDAGTRFQTIAGFGGAFTEAAAATFVKMPPEKQAEIIKAYFDPQEGHGYTLCRTHINSCDFSLGNYAYDEVDGDVDLAHFSIERDRQALIPMIKAALDVAGGALRLFASPWSPPAWMKTNGEMNHGGKLKPEYRDAWARYYCRYIREYEKEGIPIWGLSVQNEPLAVQTWDSCIYTGEEERDFVRDHLGPTLAREGLADVNLIIWDHNRDLLYERAKAVLDDPAAARYVWGTGFHWYVADCFDNVQRVHDAYPDKHLLFTEGCQEGGPHLGEWAVGERYARSMRQRSQPLDGGVGGLEPGAGRNRRAEPRGQLLQRADHRRHAHGRDGDAPRALPEFLRLHRPFLALYPTGRAAHHRCRDVRRTGDDGLH